MPFSRSSADLSKNLVISLGKFLFLIETRIFCNANLTEKLRDRVTHLKQEDVNRECVRSLEAPIANDGRLPLIYRRLTLPAVVSALEASSLPVLKSSS